MNQKEIFVLEDDEAIGMGLAYSLQKEEYQVTMVKTVAEAKKKIEERVFDLYLLDLTLPDGSGYDVCRLIKEKGDYPVIFLTAYDDEVNVVMGFELGADDYISKPFRVKELTMRIKSVLRRYKNREDSDLITVKNIQVHPKEAKVFRDEEEIILTAMEYRLFFILLNNRGRVLSRNQILENLWDIDGEFIEDNTLTVYIKRLRSKIEKNPNQPEIIKTIRGMGYTIQ